MLRGLLLCVLLILPFSGNAQIPGAGETLSVSISPEYPKPYETVAVTVKSSLIDLFSSKVTITANGQKVEEGSGVMTSYVRVGGAGEKTTITVSALSGGKTYNKTIVLRPASVALVAEPLSTTHPFYRGGGLVASEGTVRLVAIPDFQSAPNTTVKAENLVYTWRLGQQILESVSGIGKSSVTATAPVRYRDATLSVTVTTQDSSMVAYAVTTIAPSDPFIRVYLNDPLLGPLFDTALSGSLKMSSTEQTFRMVPYYFAKAPSVSWRVSGNEGGVERDVTVRTTGAGAGSAVLEANATLQSNYQTARQSLTVSFGEKGGLGIFGL